MACNPYSVTDDPIRALLVDLDISSFVETRPGCVAILQSRVIEAGGDTEAVATWVEQDGGYLDQTADFVSKSLGPNYGRVHPGETFYAVPREALAAD
jgi:hypothetical protein